MSVDSPGTATTAGSNTVPTAALPHAAAAAAAVVQPPAVKQLGLIGCGLIGGSFALALKAAGVVQHVVGYSKSPASVDLALEMGAIDAPASSAAAAAAGSDVVLLAVPVSATEATLRSIREALAPEALVMDVGSTKRDVSDAARRTLRDRVAQFVPAHPIAGKESAGIENADPALYAGRLVILTPLAQNPPELVQRAAALWGAVGAHVLRMSAQNHDGAFAAVSHLPHLLAFAYFSAVMQQPSGHEFLYLAGPGFRDFTRIAASNPPMWRDVLLANREEVLKQLEFFRQSLARFEQALQTGNASALESLIQAPSDGRTQWHPGLPPGTV
jgi:prephenate dehydrogenase